VSAPKPASCNCTGPFTQTAHENNPEGHQVSCPRWGPKEKSVPLSRHVEILRSVRAAYERDSRTLNIILARQSPDGHRYIHERCVWCGVNVYDREMYDSPESTCPGPAEGDWNDTWWPLDKVDALLAAHRSEHRTQVDP
jgi:hypothetical protein